MKPEEAQLQTTLLAVTIVYCRNNKMFKKEIDLTSVGGLWWNNPSPNPGGNQYPPGKTIPLPDPCPRTEVMAASACWWDNQRNQWVCPDGLGVE